MPVLTALATAVPEHKMPQDEVRARALAHFQAHGFSLDRMAGVYDNAGIETRYSCVPLDWYVAPHSWSDRNDLYLANALALIERAAADCLRQAGIGPEQVDALVVISSTGVATPSLDARLMERMPFRRNVLRLPIFGLGCAGGVLGLGRAAALARGMPGARILLLVVELCGLTFRGGDLSKSNVIATALFGDGAAAALIESGEDGPGVIRGWGEHTWPDSLDVMGWAVEDDGLGVIFSKDIPTLVRRDLPPVIAGFLRTEGLTLADLDGVVCHPGGAKVLDGLREVFAELDIPLDHESEVLRRYGNMSAVTVLFVLDRHRRAGTTGRQLLLALGPGFTAGFLLLDL